MISVGCSIIKVHRWWWGDYVCRCDRFRLANIFVLWYVGCQGCLIIVVQIHG